MRTNRHRRGLSLAALAAALLTAAWAAAAHNDHGCDACHIPHNAGTMPGVPLWNGNETVTTFTMYSSHTFQAAIDGQPSGASRLCLSCHDGANPNYTWMADARTFGADELVNNHPISFVYDSTLVAVDNDLKDPSQPSTLGQTIAQDLLHGESKMQCSSCHDVHTSEMNRPPRARPTIRA
jgi:nitrate/TMAO reductase-like tetraheme cytochrome c subunit